MPDANISDCGWGSCDASIYTTPSGKKIVTGITNWTKPEHDKPGYLSPTKYSGTANTVYSMGGVPYTDDYCK